VPHQYQSDRPIQEGDALITEISGGFWCHASQIHRTYTVGCEPNRLYRELEEVAEEALEAILASLREGATAEDVLDAAEIIERRGFTIFDDLLHGADQYPPILRTRETDHGPTVRTNVALRRSEGPAKREDPREAHLGPEGRVSEHVSHPAGFRFQKNMIVTVQPNVTTRDRRAGLQYGETVRVATGGVERLHRYRRGIITVGM
jgi:Xaa-Pro aminopeptidase